MGGIVTPPSGHPIKTTGIQQIRSIRSIEVVLLTPDEASGSIEVVLII